MMVKSTENGYYFNIFNIYSQTFSSIMYKLYVHISIHPNTDILQYLIRYSYSLTFTKTVHCSKLIRSEPFCEGQE